MVYSFDTCIVWIFGFPYLGLRVATVDITTDLTSGSEVCHFESQHELP